MLALHTVQHFKSDAIYVPNWPVKNNHVSGQIGGGGQIQTKNIFKI